MQYGLTSATLTRLKYDKVLPGSETDFRFCWEVHYAPICEKKLLIVIHADTRYGMVFCDIKPNVWKNFVPFLHDEIRKAMLREGFSDGDVEKYFSLTSEEVISKTHGRKAMGGMIHLVSILPYVEKELVEGMFQPFITQWINNDFCTSSIHPEIGYFHPKEFFVQEMKKLLQ